MKRLPRPRRSDVAHVEHSRRVALRRQTAISALAMLSIVVISQAGGGERRVPGSTVAQPNPPNVPGVNATPTDTSVLVSSTAFSGDVGDTHDSTKWRIRRQSDASTVLEITVGDSLTAFRGAGLGYTVPLKTDTAYDVAASHRGSGSGLWSGYGAATNFTASATSLTVAMQSDWSTATGSSSNAVLDGGKWVGNDITQLLVVNAASEGLHAQWPMTNALRVNCEQRGDNGCDAGSVLVQDGQGTSMGNPGTGESRYWRIYLIYPDTVLKASGPDEHPYENTSAGGSLSDWSWDTIMFNGYGEVAFVMHGGVAWPNADWCPLDYCNGSPYQLLPDRPYILEHAYHVVSGTEHTLDLRLWDAGADPDTLITKSNADWHNRNGSETLASFQVGNNFTFNNTGPSQLDLIDLGTSAISGDELSGHPSYLVEYDWPIYYWGGLCVASDGWPGSYGTCEGEN